MAAAAVCGGLRPALTIDLPRKRRASVRSSQPASSAQPEPLRSRKAAGVSRLSDSNSQHLGSYRSYGSRAERKFALQRRLIPINAQKERAGDLETKEDSKQTELTDSNQQEGLPTTTIAVAASVILILGATAYYIPGGPPEWIKWFEEQIESAGPLAPVYYAGAYCVCTVAFIPASILTLAAGYLFGPLVGSIVVSLSSTFGGSLAFLISRYAARPFIEERLAKNDRFVAVDKAIAREGWKIVVLLRLSPLFPFALSNYALGLTSIDFVPFVASSWIGQLPATIAYVYLGSAGKATVDAVSSGEGLTNASPLQLGLYAVGAVATVGVTTYISRIAKKALSEAEGKEEDN